MKLNSLVATLSRGRALGALLTQEVEREVVLYSQNLDYVMNTTYCRYHEKGLETINRTPQIGPSP